MVEMMAQRLLQDEQQQNQVRDEIISDKLLNALMERITIKDKSISVEDFGKVVAEAQEAAQAAQGAEKEEE